MSRAEVIVRLVHEHKGKPDPKEAQPGQQGPAAPVHDSRGEAEKARGVATEKKALIQKDIAKLLQDIRTRHPKPGADAPVGGILPPARMK